MKETSTLFRCFYIFFCTSNNIERRINAMKLVKVYQFEPELDIFLSC